MVLNEMVQASHPTLSLSGHPLDTFKGPPEIAVALSTTAADPPSKPVHGHVPVGQPVLKGSVDPASRLKCIDPNTGAREPTPVAEGVAIRPAIVRGATYGSMTNKSVTLEYRQMQQVSLPQIVAQTPKPKGKREWSSVHIIHSSRSPRMSLQLLQVGNLFRNMTT